MKKQKQTEKKLSLKKLQITKLNMIRGGDGDGDTMTNGDKTTSKYCPPPTISFNPDKPKDSIVANIY